jgi:hypothetical protein
MSKSAFIPLDAGTKYLDATAASANIALVDAKQPEVEFTNEGPDTAFVKLVVAASGTAVAPVAAGAAGDYPLAAGQSKVIRNLRKYGYAAAVCKAGKTAAVYISCGDGQ